MGFLDQYSWRRKNQFLWVGAALFMGLVYQLSIKPTIRLRHEYQQQETSRANAQADAALLLRLRAALAANTGTRTPSAINATQKPDKEELARLALQAGARVVALPVPLHFSEGGLDVAVTNSSYSGSFHELLQLLQAVEQHAAIQLLNAVFRTADDASTRQPALFLELNTYTISTPIRHDK